MLCRQLKLNSASSSSARATGPITLCKKVLSPKYLLQTLSLFPVFFPIFPQPGGPTAASGLSFSCSGIWALIHPFGVQQKDCTMQGEERLWGSKEGSRSTPPHGSGPRSTRRG